ncbi:MAG: pyroglutamyl-peptidase [Pseudohongiellaceae bacterium]
MTLRVLLTGFEPFGGEPINPSWELVRTVAAEAPPHDDLLLFSACLPVDQARYRAALAQAVEQHRPHVVLAIGQATGRPTIQLERVAHNRLEYKGAMDNGGHVIDGRTLHGDAAETLDANLPLAALCAQLQSGGHGVTVSADAGRYLCNAVLFELRHVHCDLPAAFIHIPLLPEQATRRDLGEPSMEASLTRACLRDLLCAVVALDGDA